MECSKLRPENWNVRAKISLRSILSRSCVPLRGGLAAARRAWLVAKISLRSILSRSCVPLRDGLAAARRAWLVAACGSC